MSNPGNTDENPDGIARDRAAQMRADDVAMLKEARP